MHGTSGRFTACCLCLRSRRDVFMCNNVCIRALFNCVNMMPYNPKHLNDNRGSDTKYTICGVPPSCLCISNATNNQFGTRKTFLLLLLLLVVVLLLLVVLLLFCFCCCCLFCLLVCFVLCSRIVSYIKTVRMFRTSSIADLIKFLFRTTGWLNFAAGASAIIGNSRRK